MQKVYIYGERNLKGSVNVSGSKNASIAIIAASLLVKGAVVLDNVPRVNDVQKMLELVKTIGAEYAWTDTNQLAIDCSELNSTTIDYSLTQKLHASILVVGPLAGRFGECAISLPGNDNLGPRPVDLHLKGFKLRGFHAHISNGQIMVKGRPNQDSVIYLDFPSVGATENLMLNSVLGDAVTVIQGAAKDPEIVNLASFLTSMGAKISGAGTDIIKIRGVAQLHPVSYTIMPDRMEAGTFMIMAAANRGDVNIFGVVNKHLKPVIAKLREAGAEVTENDSAVQVKTTQRLQSLIIKATPYPGFPTDLQPVISAALTTAVNTSIISEKVYKNRFQYINELRRFGAKIKVEGNTAVITGVDKLSGASVSACDTRGAAALLTAGLMADNRTELVNSEFLDNGYENWLDKLNSINGNITLV